MYEFRTLKSIYKIIIRYRRPDYTQYEYSSNIVLNAKKNKEDFIFTLEQRTETKLNNMPPRKVMDKLMLELGDAIYPLKLKVDLNGKILLVENFEEIKQRWVKKSNDLYNANKTTPFRTYLDMSSKNLVNEIKFRERLFNDTFIQMFFLAYGSKVLEFDFKNFPVQSRKSTLYAIKRPNSNYDYILHPAFKEKEMKSVEGNLHFRTNETGELKGVEVKLTLENDKGEYYNKHVSIQSDTNVHEVKTGFFF